MAFRSVLSTTVAAASFDLTTLLDALADLDLNDTTVQQKVYLRRAIAQVSAAIALECNRTFVVQTYSEEFFPEYIGRTWPRQENSDVLQLSRWPAITITSVVEDGVALVSGTDFLSSSAIGQLTRVSSSTGLPTHWATKSVVTVVYSAGYAIIPADLQDVVHRSIRVRWFSRQRDPMLKAETIPGVAEYQYWVSAGNSGGNFTPDMQDILENYRVPITA